MSILDIEDSRNLAAGDRFTFPAEVTAAAAARQAIAVSVRLDPIRLAEAQLLVSELIANALQHGEIEGRGTIVLTVLSDPTRVRITVAHAAPPIVDMSKRGMGLTLIEHLSRRWGVETGDSTLGVWFEVRPAGTGSALSELPDQDVLARAGDHQAYRDEAVRRYRSLAESLAVRFRGRGISDGDLEQVALLGLLNAISRFDPGIGPFKPYAILTIQGTLKRHLRDRAWSVRMPRSLQERSLLVASTAEALAQRLGRTVTPADVAAELDMALDEVQEALAAGAAYQSESIDAPAATTGDPRSDSMRDSFWATHDVEEWRALAEGMSSLTPRERVLLQLRFYGDMTQHEIAARLGISQMHVSRLLARTLERLRRFVE